MNICFLFRNIDGDGGVNRVAKMLISGLRDKHSISCLSVFTKIYNENISIDLPVTYMFDYVITSYRKVIIPMTMRIRSFVKKNKIDLVIATEESFAPACAAGLLGTGVKYICWSHVPADMTDLYKLQGLSRKIGVKTAKYYVSLTPEASRYIRDNMKAKHSVDIPNPADDRLMTDVHYNPGTKRIITVGRLSYQKNIEEAVEIANIVFRKHKEWIWDVFGEGDTYDSVSQKINEYGLEGRFNLKGSVKDLYSRYDEYSIMVMTSRFEGYPMALLEGMSRGLPIVSYEVSGANHIIDDGKSGYIVGQGDRKTFTERLLQLMECEMLRQEMSDENVRRRKSFSQSAFIERWEKLINN